MSDWYFNPPQIIIIPKDQIDPRICANVEAGRDWWDGIHVFEKLLPYARARMEAFERAFRSTKPLTDEERDILDKRYHQ